jgi:hypothetical protein
MDPQEAVDVAAVIVAALALVFSVYSLFVLQRERQMAEKRAKDAEDITRLLGENETVAFAALKLQTDGLPPDLEHRKLVLGAMMTACVFTNADRARAILYDVIDMCRNEEPYNSEIREALDNVTRTFRTAQMYDFPRPTTLDHRFDLSKGMYRLRLVETVYDGRKKPGSGAPAAGQEGQSAANSRCCVRKPEPRHTRLARFLCHRVLGTSRLGVPAAEVSGRGSCATSAPPSRKTRADQRRPRVRGIGQGTPSVARHHRPGDPMPPDRCSRG